MSDRPTDELLRRVLASASALAEADAKRILADARAEAEAEVKELLKSALKAALLDRAAAELESALDLLEHPEPEPAPTVTGGESAVYVYAIVRGGGGARADELGGPVEPEHPVRAVRHEDLQAIVSEVPLGGFGTAEQLKDIEWVEQRVSAHDRVVKAALARGPVIPLRFGTIFRDERDVRRVLARNRDQLAATLDALDGRREWGVRVLARDVVETADEEEDARQSSGRAYLVRKRRKRDAGMSDERRAEVDALLGAIEQRLAAVSVESVRLPPRKTRPAGDVRTEMVLNAAYLVEESHVEALRATVATLAAAHEPDGLVIELTGPWPAYNFVRLDLALDGDDDAGDEAVT
jgi:hypothetical protein